MSNPFASTWRWKKLAMFNLIGIFVLASWWWAPTRQLWDALDLNLFHALNAPLANHPNWAKFWAITNMRPFDIGVGIILFGLLMKRDWAFAARQVRHACMAMFALLVLMVLIRIGFVSLLKALEWKRASASLTVDGAVRLTQMFPDWQANWYLKDSSEQSFPGDHASVLMMWLMLVWGFLRGAKLALACALTTFFMLPRLVAGAHWGSDDFVGGLFLAFIAFGWGFYSPFAARASAILDKICAPIFHILNKIPLLNKLSVISGV